MTTTLTTVNQLLTSIADAGRDLLRKRRPTLEAMCRDLMSTRGEASGVALARELVRAAAATPSEGRLAFFVMLAERYGVDRQRLAVAVEAYARAPAPDTLAPLREATGSRRLELFRRMNMAPDGTRALIALREQLLDQLDAHPALREVDADLQQLLASWFNPGFLALARITWDSPASLLDRLVRCERVHRMAGLEDFKRRLAADRRCFAYLHPALPAEPLIVVQVALGERLADKVQPLIDGRTPVADPAGTDTAIFYSISNCQPGLRGVPLGNFLIKGVVAALGAELPQIRTFATLSPIPGFAAWLRDARTAGSLPLPAAESEALALLDAAGWADDPAAAERLRPVLLRLGAHYLARERQRGRPRDPVARFHLGNGARLERLNWLGDRSRQGLAQSHGLLANYRYDPGSIERNHELFAARSEVIASAAVRGLLPPQQGAHAAP